MTFSFEDCLTVENILSNALVSVNDEGMKLFTKGWYTKQVKDGLDELNYHSPFLQTKKDIPLTSNLIIPVPSGVWDTIDLFIWNGSGTCEDACKISEVVRLFHKRNVHTTGYGYGYTARHMSNSADYLLENPYQFDSEVFYYNVVMGNYELSPACIDYENLRIVYNGVPGVISAVKFIPPFVKPAIEAFVVEKTFAALKARDIKYRPLWSDAKEDLYGQRGTEPSKWDKAQAYLKRLDKKVFNDLSENLGQLYY